MSKRIKKLNGILNMINYCLNNGVHLRFKSSTPKTAPRIRGIFIETFAEGYLFYKGLVKMTSYNAPYHARKILDQRRIYEDEHIEEVLEKAMEFGAFSYQIVDNILKGYP